MVIGGIVAIFFGVHAEQKSLESLAKPLTADDSDDYTGRAGPEAAHGVT